jgi:hypothetical protein
MPVEADKRCGQCRFFDKNKLSGEPVGINSWKTGQPLTQGFCRTKDGVRRLGVIDEAMPCRLPEILFEAKAKLQTPPTA